MSSRVAARTLLASGLTAAGLYLALPRGGRAQAVVFLLVLAMAVGAVVVRVVRDPGIGRMWRLLAAGAAVYLAASVPWHAPVLFGVALPFPGPIDILYFVSYGLYAAFLVALLRQRAAGRDDRTATVAVLDATIVTLGASTVLWEQVIEPQLTAPGIGAAARAAAVAYPAFTVLLFALGTRLALDGFRVRVAGSLVMLWLSGELLADLAYGYSSATGTFVYGSPECALWLVSYAGLAALALHPELPDLAAPAPAVRRGGRRWRFALVGGAALLPVGIVAPRVAGRGHPDDALLLAVAAVAVALVLVRLSLVSGDLTEQRRVTGELHRVSEELRHQALRDPLTGLGNRAMLAASLRHAVDAGSGPDGACTAVLLLDLDSFKAINDTLGHDAGDSLLVEASKRLSQTVRPDDTVTRMGGDEFAIVLEQVQPQKALGITERVLEALRQPVQVGGQQLLTRASIGVYLAEESSDVQHALTRVDLAMYAAKALGGDRFEVFNHELERDFLARQELEMALRAAPDDGSLRLHYQPVIELATATIVGVEALVRWQHPTRGLLPPGAFIDVAEECGAIVGIGRWVLEEACAQAFAWGEDGVLPARFDTAVNLSRRQLLDPRLVDDVAAILERTGLPPARLVLEVTETALMSDTDQLVARLEDLRALGIAIAMDDFGTGYSSLDQLRRLPIDVLKIDRAFVEGIGRGREDFALATAIVRLATSLGKRTLAEGVETGAQLAHLRTLRADMAQGYLFSKPLPADELRSGWLPLTTPPSPP